METEIFTLCDHAQDIAGKMVIVGTFDAINSKQFPCVHPSCSLACRLRFSEKELGRHGFKIRLIDDQGNELIKPLEFELDVQASQLNRYSTVNIPINMEKLQFERPGRYSFELYIDGDWKSGLPLSLIKVS